MEGKVTKKKTPWFAVVLLVLVVALAVGIGVFFAGHTQVNGRYISTGVETLDLRYSGLADLSGLERCRALKSLDLRGNDLDPEALARLAEALPGCTILSDVAVGEVRYDSLTTDLTLPDLPENWENLTQLTRLQSLTVERCTNPAAMLTLAERMSACRMRWNVGLGGGWYDTGAESLEIPESAVYFEELLAQLQWFPALKSVSLGDAVLTAEQQRALMAAYEDITFRWNVAAGSMLLSGDTQSLRVDDAADLAALGEVLDLLPALRELELTGSDIPAAERVAFRAAHPELDVSWTVPLLDNVYPCDTQLLDFNNRKFSEEDLLELAEAIPYFPDLAQVELCECGLSNEELGALNREFEDVKIIWTVHFGYNNYYTLRTDAEYFRPSEFGADPPAVANADMQILRYCTELRGLDLGHQYFTELTFLESMPHMTYLIVAECPISDISPLAGLKELRYLEIFNTYVSDLTPLVECPGLRALNLCYIHARQNEAWEALSQMPWVEYLWYCNCPLTNDQLKELKSNNPDLVTFTIRGGESSGGTWRYNEYYYEMRDFFNAWYMPGGTNGVDDDGAQIIIDDHGTEFHLQNYDGSQYWWLQPQYADMNPYIIGLTD